MSRTDGQGILQGADIQQIRDIISEELDIKINPLKEDLKRLDRRIRDIERDMRTDQAITRANAECFRFKRDRSASTLKGNKFLEEIKDDY